MRAWQQFLDELKGRTCTYRLPFQTDEKTGVIVDDAEALSPAGGVSRTLTMDNGDKVAATACLFPLGLNGVSKGTNRIGDISESVSNFMV
jgi:hypothetical protein